MIVKVGKMGGTVKEAILDDNGATVQDALTATGMSTENLELRLNSANTSLTASVKDGDIITLVPPIKGGRA